MNNQGGLWLSFLQLLLVTKVLKLLLNTALLKGYY